MFESLIRELERMQGETTISVPLETDSEGYFDKECPSEACLFGFKVHEEDWSSLVRDEEVFCPSCRHAAPARSWFTRDQVELAKDYAFKKFQGRINGAMRQDARDWNRRQRSDAFLKITMEVKGGHEPLLMPIAAAEPMRLRTQCETCACRYSYIGAAFFCPACGANSAQHTFRQTLETIRMAARAESALRAALDRDQAEVMIRSLLEKGFQDTVMSFQRLAEQIYAKTHCAEPPRRNAFQNLDAGSALWADATGKAYDQLISAEEMRQLRVYFQQRHLLAHCQGIVDADYIERSGDHAYTVGQRLVLRDGGLLDFITLAEKLGTAMIGAPNSASS